jgi:hypothetical protein
MSRLYVHKQIHTKENTQFLHTTLFPVHSKTFQNLQFGAFLILRVAKNSMFMPKACIFTGEF